MFKLKSVLLLFLDLIVFGILVPPSLPILCILYIYKCIVTIIAKLVDPTLSSLEGSIDTFVSLEKLKDTKNVIGNVGSIIQVDGKVDINWLRKKFESSFLGKNNYENYHRYFSTYVQFGGYTFRKTLPPSTIDLNLQIVESEVPQNLSLNEFIRIWFNKPYKALFPLWEIMLFLISTGDEKNACCFIVYKMHHNLGDGYTLINFLDILTDSETPYVVKDFNDTTLDKLALLIKYPRVLLCYLIDIFKITKDIPLPVTSEECKNAPAFHTTMTFDLKDFKTIRNKTGVSFQSILLSLLASLTRRIALDDLKKNENAQKTIPDYTYILNSLPWPNHPKPKMSNHCTTAVFKVPLKEMSAYERLIEVDQSYRFIHDSEIHKILYRYHYPLISLYPAPILRRIFRANTGQQLVLSSLLGYSGQQYLNGHPIKRMNLMMGKRIPTYGLIGLCFTHSEQLNFTLIGTVDVFQSQERADTIIQKYLREEFETLVASLQDVNAIPIANPEYNFKLDENIV